MINLPEGLDPSIHAKKGICGVVAVAICAGVSLEVARQTLKQVMLDFSLGERFRGGTFTGQRHHALNRLGVKWEHFRHQAGSQFTLKAFAEVAKPDTTYMVCVPSHVVTVRNGWIADQGSCCPAHLFPRNRRRVKHFTEILGKGW